MDWLQQSVRSGWLRAIKKVGLALASRWPLPVRARLVNGRRMFVDLRSVVGRAIYMKGEFDPMVFPPLREVLRPGDTFLDVGANVGFYSVLAHELVGSGGQVHAFEIDPRPLRCLRRTINASGWKNVHVHAIAVGNHNGTAHLTARSESGNSSVTAAGDGRAVPMTTLDSWRAAAGVKGIRAIKMDIEGGELWALQGADRLLREDRPVLVCEIFHDVEARAGYKPQALTELLAGYDYQIEHLKGVWSPTIVARPRGKS